MTCPQCGGDVWDNRPKKRAGEMKPNGPDFACKDKENCGWLQWPAKDQAVRKQAAGPGMPQRSETVARAPKWTWPELSQTYQQAMIVARKSVMGMGAALKMEVSMEHLLSATACIFIEACRNGIKLQALSRVPDEESEEEEITR